MSSDPDTASHPAGLRLGLVQFKPEKRAVDSNLRRMAEGVGEAAGSVDVVVFPETAVSGYFVEGGVREVARTHEQVAEALGSPPPEAPDVVVGFYELWRGRLYNAVGYFTPAQDGYVAVHVHRKIFLPTYGVFDEDRFVESGTEVRAFDTRFGRFGLLVCEDAWHSMTGTALAVAGAELILVVSATPARGMAPGTGRPTNLERWERILRVMAVEHGVFVGVAHLVGSEGGKLFAGDSLVVDPDGTLLARAPLMEEGRTDVVLDPSGVARARAGSPLLSDLEKVLPHLGQALTDALDAGRGRSGNADPGSTPWSPPPLSGQRSLAGTAVPGPDPQDRSCLDIDPALVTEMLVGFLRDEIVRRRGFEDVVVGVSGGVDSAVSVALAARALGPEHVHAFRLPSRTSSPASLEDAEAVTERFGVASRTIDISAMVDGYLEAHEPEPGGLRRGNVAARSRAVILFDQAARLGGLPLGTGNKSERLLGYYTWHADDSPPVNPLGDLFKTQVWALARYLGVPAQVIDKPASADLVEGVHDEDELGIGYAQADPILHWLLLGFSAAELVARGFEAEHVERVRARLEGTHWKRRLPTVAMLSSTAIGEAYLRPVDY